MRGAGLRRPHGLEHQCPGDDGHGAGQRLGIDVGQGMPVEHHPGRRRAVDPQVRQQEDDVEERGAVRRHEPVHGVGAGRVPAVVGDQDRLPAQRAVHQALARHRLAGVTGDVGQVLDLVGQPRCERRQPGRPHRGDRGPGAHVDLVQRVGQARGRLGRADLDRELDGGREVGVVPGITRRADGLVAVAEHHPAARSGKLLVDVPLALEAGHVLGQRGERCRLGGHAVLGHRGLRPHCPYDRPARRRLEHLERGQVRSAHGGRTDHAAPHRLADTRTDRRG